MCQIERFCLTVIAPLRSAVKGKVVEKEDHSQFEPFKYRYRRAAGSIDTNKLSCTLKMRVSFISPSADHNELES